MYEHHFRKVMRDLVEIRDGCDLKGGHTHLLVKHLYVANYFDVHALLTDGTLLLSSRVVVVRDPLLNFDPGSSTVIDSVHYSGGTLVDFHHLANQTHLFNRTVLLNIIYVNGA